jgi:hypothetical protein
MAQEEQSLPKVGLGFPRLAESEIEADIADRTRLAPDDDLKEDLVAARLEGYAFQHRSAHREQPTERVHQPAAGRH